jgi:hypothetical protein
MAGATEKTARNRSAKTNPMMAAVFFRSKRRTPKLFS